MGKLYPPVCPPVALKPLNLFPTTILPPSPPPPLFELICSSSSPLISSRGELQLQLQSPLLLNLDLFSNSARSQPGLSLNLLSTSTLTRPRSPLDFSPNLCLISSSTSACISNRSPLLRLQIHLLWLSLVAIRSLEALVSLLDATEKEKRDILANIIIALHMPAVAVFWHEPGCELKSFFSMFQCTEFTVIAATPFAPSFNFERQSP
ncbi:uncharacterized protein LOC109847257 [Asparagus officinalis]|uniref:uncharacterized protein LOC109847257 n=1 Tax=Asparagus officinalis TaxID=4686 RepID=UPI00098E79ED|nr:uncharacterized protein LOC109847257 [Asparagus officinalis]